MRLSDGQRPGPHSLPRITSGPTLLTGICFCAACGKAMTLWAGKGGGSETGSPGTCSAQRKALRQPLDRRSAGNRQLERDTRLPLRQAGAIARTMLVSAAAKKWKVEPASCRAERGEVIHAASGRRIKYGALTTDAAKLP